MYFTTLKPMDTNCPIIGPLYVQCQTVKKLEIHCSSVRHWNKTLPGYILIVGILQILLNALNSIRLTKGILSESAACGACHFLAPDCHPQHN